MKTYFPGWKHKLSIVVLLAVSIIALSGCDIFPWLDPGSSDSPPQPVQPSDGGENPPAASKKLPDLMVSSIEVRPAQPQSGQHFGINVYVRNAGQAPSGDYELAIMIKDVSRGSTYPVGTFRQERLQPGDNVAAYTSNDRLVNDAGSYQVVVEIIPFQFEDGNQQNNMQIWAFTAK